MQKQKRFDLSVYFVADPSLCAGRDVVDVVRAAVRGGTTMVQLRDKSGRYDSAKILRDFLKPLSVPFLINDRVDIALAVDADGVHLGQGDMAAASARTMLGGDKIIGVTAFEKSHFKAIDPAVVDYAGTGPFYPTQTDKGKPVLGAEKFQELLRLSPVPVVGIGGITPENAAAVLQCGAAGVAMMRSISAAENPEDAAQAFVEIVQDVRRAA